MDNILLLCILVVLAIIYFQNNPEAKEKPIYKKTSIFVEKCSTALKELISDL